MRLIRPENSLLDTDDRPLLLTLKAAHDSRVCFTPDKPVNDDFVVDNFWNLHTGIQICQQLQPIEFSQRHQRASIAEDNSWFAHANSSATISGS